MLHLDMEPTCLAPSSGILQDHRPLRVARGAPYLDFLERTETAKTRVIVVQAAVPYARGSGGGVGSGHWCIPLAHLRAYAAVAT